MASNSEQVMQFMNSKVEMMKRSEEMQKEGEKQNSQAITAEWEGTLFDNMITLSVDSFVKM